MTTFKVMEASVEEIAKEDADPKYMPKGTLHSTLEACNESVARANHRRGMIDGKYPKRSWIEFDE